MAWTVLLIWNFFCLFWWYLILRQNFDSEKKCVQISCAWSRRTHWCPPMLKYFVCLLSVCLSHLQNLQKTADNRKREAPLSTAQPALPRARPWRQRKVSSALGAGGATNCIAGDWRMNIYQLLSTKGQFLLVFFGYCLKHTTLTCNRSSAYNNKEVCNNIKTKLSLQNCLVIICVYQLIYLFGLFSPRKNCFYEMKWWLVLSQTQIKCFGKSSLIAHFLNVIVFGLHLSK